MQPDQAEQGGEYRKLLEELWQARVESGRYDELGRRAKAIAERYRAIAALAKEPQP